MFDKIDHFKLLAHMLHDFDHTMATGKDTPVDGVEQVYVRLVVQKPHCCTRKKNYVMTTVLVFSREKFKQQD